MNDIMNNHKIQGELKIQLTTKSNNTEILIGNETDEIIEERFDSLV